MLLFWLLFWIPTSFALIDRPCIEVADVAFVDTEYPARRRHIATIYSHSTNASSLSANSSLPPTSPT